MLRKIEGIIISKRLYRSRDIISKVLLRSGKVVNVAFNGGTSNKKYGPIIELGNMLCIELRTAKRNVDVYSAKECSVLWQHIYLRNNYKSYYILCFYLELLSRVTVSSNLLVEEDYNDSSFEGIFRISSNAIYQLEQFSKEKTIDGREYSHTIYFTLKMLIEFGVYPKIDNCVICGNSSFKLTELAIAPESGGLICRECGAGEYIYFDGHLLLKTLDCVKNIKYKNLSFLDINNKGISISLLKYLCYQTGLNFNIFGKFNMFL